MVATSTRNRISDGIDGKDAVGLYLEGIAKTPLLTAAEEVELAKTIEVGLYAEKIRSGVVTPAERGDDASQPTTEELDFLIEDGRRALQRFVTANLRLVVSVARKYGRSQMPLLDLVQEGNTGLIRAVEKFDYTKGFKFSTYATWWIRQAITRSIADQARTIRIPVHMVETINRIVRVNRQLQQKLGREPRPEEIAKELGISVSKVQEIIKIAQEPVSLESPIGEEEDSHLGDFLEDDKTPPPSQIVAESMMKQTLSDVLHMLTPREEQVIRMRYGLDDGQQRTLEEVGKAFNVTRERIRQIEVKALRKIKRPNMSKNLVDYMD